MRSLHFFLRGLNPKMSLTNIHIPNALLALEQPGDGVFREMDWLEQSRNDSRAFFRLLFEHHATHSSQPFKSIPGIGIDLYHDLIIRHQNEGGGRPAFICREPKGASLPIRGLLRNTGQRSDAWNVLSYAALHSACTERCQQWEARGMKAGDSLCIVASMDRELLIALLSGLRMGLAVTVLPPRGPEFLARRIAAIPNAQISCERRYASLLQPFMKRCHFVEDLPPPGVAFASAIGSLTSAAEQPVLALFSPHGHVTEDLQPCLQQAQTVLENALRDGLFYLSLRPGTVLAAPESDLLQYQPGLLLTCLLHGATYLHIGASDLLAEPPDDKWPTPLHVLLITERVRDTLLQRDPKAQPLGAKGLRLWIRDALTPASESWDDLIERCSLRSVAASALWYDSAAGGCQLISLRGLGRPPRYLRAAAGLPFRLRHPGNQRDTARGSLALWEPVPLGAGLLLAASNGGYLYAGTLRPSQQGRCYPTLEVEETLSDIPFVVGISAVCEEGDSGVITLLIFTGPEPLDEARSYASARQSTLRERIQTRIDPSYQPTNIELYAMYPRLRDGRIDHKWCAQEFAKGTLRSREADPIFQLLDSLRAACAASRGEATGSSTTQKDGNP